MKKNVMCICKCCGETSVYINSDEIRDYLGKYCSQCHVKFLKEYDIIPDDDKTLEKEKVDEIWITHVSYEDDEVVDNSCFKNKEDALNFIVLKFRDLLYNSDSYDDDGDLEASRISLGCRKFKLN